MESITDRQFLSSFELDYELFEKFGVQVKDLYPGRNEFVISTDKGDKILKKLVFSKEELQFIDEVLSYIENNFNRISTFCKALDGSICVEFNGDYYYMLNFNQGGECDFKNPVDITIASRGIGELHKAGEGFKCNLPIRDMTGKLIEANSKKIKETMFFKDIANIHENKTEFDKLFLKLVDDSINDALMSIELMKQYFYYKSCSDKEKITICNNDLSYHNILINNDKAYFVNFDYCNQNLKVVDLCNFINRVLREHEYDKNLLLLIINGYTSKNTITSKELDFLEALMYFPEDFYNISKDYYTKKRVLLEENYVYKLGEKTKFIDQKKDLLKNFKLILKEFNYI